MFLGHMWRQVVTLQRIKLNQKATGKEGKCIFRKTPALRCYPRNIIVGQDGDLRLSWPMYDMTVGDDNNLWPTISSANKFRLYQRHVLYSFPRTSYKYWCNNRKEEPKVFACFSSKRRLRQGSIPNESMKKEKHID